MSYIGHWDPETLTDHDLVWYRGGEPGDPSTWVEAHDRTLFSFEWPITDAETVLPRLIGCALICRGVPAEGLREALETLIDICEFYRDQGSPDRSHLLKSPGGRARVVGERERAQFEFAE